MYPHLWKPPIGGVQKWRYAYSFPTLDFIFDIETHGDLGIILRNPGYLPEDHRMQLGTSTISAIVWVDRRCVPWMKSHAPNNAKQTVEEWLDLSKSFI